MNYNNLKPIEAGDEEVADMANEAGSIGDEQCPAYVEKTDKHDWDGAADKAKGDHLIPKPIREFFAGL